MYRRSKIPIAGANGVGHSMTEYPVARQQTAIRWTQTAAALTIKVPAKVSAPAVSVAVCRLMLCNQSLRDLDVMVAL